MERLNELEQDIFELELAIKWAHGASIMDEIPEVSHLFFVCEVALKEKLERMKKSRTAEYCPDCGAKMDSATAQNTAKLDRSRWRSRLDGCPCCWEPDCNCCAYAARREELEPCKSCVKGYQESEGMDAPGYVTANYCHHCGRPLTEEAWAELERKIGGKTT